MNTRSAVNMLMRVGVLAVTCSAMLPGAELSSTLTVGVNFVDGEWISQGRPIELNLSRPLGPTDGRLAVFLNEMDLTPLFTLEGTKFTIRPTFPSLPTGEHTMIVYLFRPDESWQEVGRFPLRIEERPPEPVLSEPAAPAGGTAAQWAATWVPSVTLNIAHQSTLDYYPDTNRPQRKRFTDVSLQASVQTGLARGLFNTQTQFDIMGASFEQEALRYGQMGDRAPQVDLSSYLGSVEINKVKVQLGHTSFGSHRYLINSFSSRGVTLTVPIAGWADVSFSGMNGTSIVGWDNFLGLSRRRHQVYGGTLGFELAPKRPGGARLELCALRGSLLPESNYTQSNLNDAETSRGYGARFLASDAAQRLRLEAGVAQSRFTNPSDPLLDQGTTVVPVRATTGLAHYLDASYQMLRDRPVTEQWKAGLTLALRYSRVDPLYRSVAVFAQADRFDIQYEVAGNIGDITAAGSYTRGNDNLAGVASVLKTLTRRANGQLAVPLRAVVVASGLGSKLLPRVGYSYDRTHQYGAGLPVNGDFDPSSVPDQVSVNQILAADWQLDKWRFGYRLNQSFQDNRQIGRIGSDLKNRVHSMTVGVSPQSRLDVNFDLSSERSLNYETGARYQIWRSTAGLSLQTTLRSTLTLSVGTTFEGDVAKSNNSRNIDFDAQWAAGFSRQKDRYRKLNTQFFVRFAQRYASSYDHVFITENLTRLQTANAGLKITFF